MTITFYELAGAEDDRRFSPFCWRTRLALLHKGLPFEAVPWRFTEKDAIAFTGQGKVPVLVDGEHPVWDSWQIAQYLEDAYPDRPSLFGGPVGKGLSRFVADWTERVVQPGLLPLIIGDLFAHVAPKDQAYFRQTREARLGNSLEAVAASRDSRLPGFREALGPLRATLGTQPYLCGDAPAWADYAAFSPFQWARVVSPYRLLAEDDPLFAWRGRMLAAFDGAAGKVPGYPV